MSEQETTGLQSQVKWMYKKIRVVSGVITKKEDGVWKVLGLQRRKDQKLPNMWHLPGGHVDKDDWGDVAAIERELFEELNIKACVGLDSEIANILVHYPHGLFDVHFYRVKSFEGVPVNKEHQDMEWLSELDLGFCSSGTWLEGDLEVAKLVLIEKRMTEGVWI